MTKPAQNGEAAAGAGVLASEGSQDIWGQASRYASQHPANSGRDEWRGVVAWLDIQNCAKASPSSR